MASYKIRFVAASVSTHNAKIFVLKMSSTDHLVQRSFPCDIIPVETIGQGTTSGNSGNTGTGSKKKCGQF